MNGNQRGGNDGRIEICFGGRWGTICDDSWDYHDAAVVCRQLGLGTIGELNMYVNAMLGIQATSEPSLSGARAYSGSQYGPGRGPVYLDNVGCTGSEKSLLGCRQNVIGDVSPNCRSHFEDASVICTSKWFRYSNRTCIFTYELNYYSISYNFTSRVSTMSIVHCSTL